MAQSKHLDDLLRGRIIRRLECGRTQLEVSEELGIAQSVISRLWQRFQDDGNVSRCYSTGHPLVTTLNEDRYIWQLLPKETDGAQHQTCLVSSLQLPVRQFQGRPCTDAQGTLVYMHVGLSDVCSIYRNSLSPAINLEYREHALWTLQQWSCVMFSDESRFNLQSDSRRTLIWRAPGTRYHQENSIERHRYGGAGWLV
ncbi:transposable element Tcb1 transposase [Trichonephila clavipes]|nr:transposable element Tcb1 transposase [Trichonephila clavipes]